MRRRALISLALFAGLSFEGCLDAATGPSGIELLIQKARSLEARNRTDLAAQVWQQVLINDPEQSDALAGLVRWSKQSGNIREENAYLIRLRKISSDAPVRMSLREPGFKEKDNARLAKAAQLSAAQHYGEAMQIYTEVFGEHPETGGWALAYYQTEARIPGRSQAALDALRKLAQQYPDVPDYRVAIGTLLTYRPKSRHAGITELASVESNTPLGRKAQQAWRQALVWEKRNPAFQTDLEKYLARYSDAQLADTLQAMRILSASRAAASSIARSEQLGYAALKQGRLQESEADFRSALLKDPRNSRALAGIGFAHMKIDAFADAAKDFQEAIQYDPTNKELQDALRSAQFWAAMQLASHAAEQSDWPAAVQDYQTALGLRSNHPDALRGLAGAYLRLKNNQQALQVGEELIRLQPDNADNWKLCLAAENQTAPKAARERLGLVPDVVLQKLANQPEFQILQASIVAGSGYPDEARNLLRQLGGTDTLSQDAKAELANVQMQVGDFASAIPILRELLAHEPDCAEAWEPLISALVSARQPKEAERVLTRIPDPIREVLFHHPGFLQSVASMDQLLGNAEKAIEDLSKVVALPAASGDDLARENAKIQLADLLFKSGYLERSEDLLESVLTTRPDSENAWRAYVAVLAEQQQYGKILAAFNSMPPSVAFRLARDSGVVSSWAEAEARTGNAGRATLLLQNQLLYLKRQGSVVPAPLEIQLSWLLLDTPGRERDLYHLLVEERARPDLTASQHKEISGIWITWILRTAEDAKTQGQWLRSQEILEQGITAFAQDNRLKSAYAGNLMQRGETKRAFNAYSNWGLRDAGASDYAGAIGAALADHKFQYVDDWITTGLTQWPADATLLQLAGDRARAKGDFKNAEQYWRRALAVKQAHVELSAGLSLRALLVGNEPESERVSEPPTDSRDAVFSRTADSYNGSDNVKLRTALFEPLGTQASLGPPAQQVSTGSSLVGPAPSPAVESVSPTDELANRIAGLESRNTPLLTSGVTVGRRNGQAGFDRLLVEQTDIEASTTVADAVRVTLAAKPTYLEGGRPDGQSTLSFGALGPGKSFGLQTAAGLAAEAQLSSANYGLRLGSSPYGFLTHNFIGGLRLDPANGPITFLIERDSIKDTLLSYAGARDLSTNQVWGGVVANALSVQGHRGNDKSGIYASTGYQLLSGKNVAGNSAITGNVGSYWKVLSRKHDGVTVGLNFSAMHYDKNLRYFTLGQGGYFSPQQYFLFGIPFHWSGTYGQRLQYSVGGSLGVQQFTEDASAFFPDDAIRQATSGKFYPALRSTGANFSFDGRLVYQLAPQWFAGAFLEASNARNYTSVASGFFVKYTFERRPLAFDDTSVPSVPDWRGQQPFSLLQAR